LVPHEARRRRYLKQSAQIAGLCDTLTERKDVIRVEGRVAEPAPNNMWRVQLDNGHTVLAHLSEKLRMSPIRIIPGDRVAIELSPFDLTRGRIVERVKRIT
jgi:translation initiation factor IF-1